MKDKELAELIKLGKRLGVPIIQAFLELEVRDNQGKVIARHRQRSHSWVRNAYNQLVSQLMGINCLDVTFGAGKITLKETDGNICSFARCISIAGSTSDPEAVGYAYRAGAGIDTFGILVGSGVTAETFEDWFLDTQIANGVGAGQLSYVEADAPVKEYTPATKVYQVKHIRYFNNNSGESIDVKEIGLVTSGDVGGVRVWMNARDLLPSPVAVPDTGQLKVTYTLEITYPA